VASVFLWPVGFRRKSKAQECPQAHQPRTAQ